MVFDFFSIIIYLVLFVIIGFVIKAFFDIKIVKEKGHRAFLDLLEDFDIENNKSKRIHEKVILVNSFHQSIIKKLFKINKELLKTQKLIFDK